jgi:hypothetical protein
LVVDRLAELVAMEEASHQTPQQWRAVLAIDPPACA